MLLRGCLMRPQRVFSSSSSFASVPRRAFSSDAEVLFSRTGQVLTATLNRPKALNAVNLNMIRLLQQELKTISEDTSALVLRGAGGKAFCAGGDVVAVVNAAKEDRSQPDNLSRQFFFEEYICDYSMARLSETVPTVAILDGFTMGGGVGLALPCMFRIATPKTVFAMPETAIGLFCDVGGSYFLSRMEGTAGRYLGLSGARLVGKQVADMAVATHYVEDEAALADLENRLVGVRKPTAVKAILDEIEAPMGTFPDSFWGQHGAAINQAFSKDSVEAIMDTLAQSENELLVKAHKAMTRASPLSMKVVFEQLRRGRRMSLEDVFEMEYSVVQSFMDRSDFAEGVRALLIDKDNKPQWNPATLAEVPDELVQSYFQPLPQEQLLTKAHLESNLPDWLPNKKYGARIKA